MSTNKRIAQSDKLAEVVDEIHIGAEAAHIGAEAAAEVLTLEGLRLVVIALVEQQAIANRIALGNYDRDELLKQTDV